MEGGSITDQKKKNNTFGFNVADEKMKLIDIQSENDDFLVASPFCEDSFPEVGIIEPKEQNLMRRSLAWDSAFFNSAGVLDPYELSFMNRGFRKTETHLHDVCNRSSESKSTPNAYDISADWLEVEKSLYNSMSCNALNVFDKSPEPGLRQKGKQDVQALKKVDESSRSKMKCYQTSIVRSINVQSEVMTKKEPTSRRRNGTTPSPLPHKAVGSAATNISTKLNNKENLCGKSYLKVDKRSTTSCFISPKASSVPPSINESIPASSAQASTLSKRETDPGKSRHSASIPTSKIWRNRGLGNDINASLSLSSSKRISIEPKDAKQALALKGSVQSSFSSANRSHASPGTRLSMQTLKPSGIRPPSSHTRFSHENSAPNYHGETRTRKLPQKVISKGTTFGCSSNGNGSACKKLKTPCSDVSKNIKRPKIESLPTSRVMKLETGRVVDQENRMKKPSYSFDRLENLTQYFGAIDLNQEKRVQNTTKSM